MLFGKKIVKKASKNDSVTYAPGVAALGAGAVGHKLIKDVESAEVGIKD